MKVGVGLVVRLRGATPSMATEQLFYVSGNVDESRWRLDVEVNPTDLMQMLQTGDWTDLKTKTERALRQHVRGKVDLLWMGCAERPWAGHALVLRS